MAKRDFRQSAEVPFGEERPAVSDSWLQADSEIFGAIVAADAQNERVKLINIFEITGNIAQPRRAVPSAVRANWDGNPLTIADMFSVWWDVTQQERGKAFPLEALLLEDEANSDRSEQPGPIETSLLQIIDLAVSIRRDGLTNPITIVPNAGRYLIETGERRWLAYHLLYAFFDGKQPERPDEREVWSKIPTRTMNRFDVWRQATENTARADLNAVGRARQFAILMMDLWASDEKKPRRFRPVEAFDHEQAYYAQAVDLPTPHGKGDILLNAMGFKHRNAIQRYRDLLTLPRDIWQMADDYNCPESILRDLVKLPHQEALRRFAAWARTQNIAISDTLSPSKISQTLPAVRPALLTDPACFTGNRLFLKSKEQEIRLKLKELLQLKDGVAYSSPDTKKQIRQMTVELRRLLDLIDRALGDT